MFRGPCPSLNNVTREGRYYKTHTLAVLSTELSKMRISTGIYETKAWAYYFPYQHKLPLLASINLFNKKNEQNKPTRGDRENCTWIQLLSWPALWCWQSINPFQACSFHLLTEDKIYNSKMNSSQIVMEWLTGNA